MHTENFRVPEVKKRPESPKNDIGTTYRGGDAALGNQQDPDRFKEITAKDLTKHERRIRSILSEQYETAQARLQTSSGKNPAHWFSRMKTYDKALGVLLDYQYNRKAGAFDKFKANITEAGPDSDVHDALLDAVKKADQQYSQNIPVTEIPPGVFASPIENKWHQEQKKLLTIESDTTTDYIQSQIAPRIIDDAISANKAFQEVGKVRGSLVTELYKIMKEDHSSISPSSDNYQRIFNNKLIELARSRADCNLIIEQYDVTANNIKERTNNITDNKEDFDDWKKNSEEYINQAEKEGRSLVKYSATEPREKLIEAIRWHKLLAEKLPNSTETKDILSNKKIERFLFALETNADYIKTLTNNKEEWFRDGFLTWEDTRER